MDASLQVPDPPSPKRGGGPLTQEGISITKYNSTVHGFTDRRTVIARLGERKEEYLALVDAFLDAYRPQTEDEVLIVHELATNRWRIARPLRFESALIEMTLNAIEAEETHTLKVAEGTISESRERLDGARGVLELVRAASKEGKLSWEAIPDSLWEETVADLEPHMASLPASELGGMRTPEEVIGLLRRELSFDDTKIHTECLRIAERNVASAQMAVEESIASRDASAREFALRKDAAGLLSDADWQRVHRSTSSLEKEFRQKLEILIKLQQIRRDGKGALVRELPPPGGVGGGAEKMPEVQA